MRYYPRARPGWAAGTQSRQRRGAELIEMATLKLETEADQIVSEEAHELVERLRAVVRQIPADTVWNCWVSAGAQGLSIRLQEARRVVPRGGARDSTRVTYSGGGTVDFLVADVAAWLRMGWIGPSPPAGAPTRRRVDGSTRRPRRN